MAGGHCYHGCNRNHNRRIDFYLDFRWCSGSAYRVFVWRTSGLADRGIFCCDFYPLVFYKTMGKKVSGESKGCDQLRGVRVIEEVDNRKESGKVLYNGMEWTARAAEDQDVFAVDEQAVVSEIRGVKMILKRK